MEGPVTLTGPEGATGIKLGFHVHHACLLFVTLQEEKNEENCNVLHVWCKYVM